MVFLKGKIVTVDKEFSIAEAVAVSDGKILAVGSNKAIEKYIGERTQKIDLNGRTMLPGINDSHGHPLDWATSRPPFTLDVSDRSVKSIDDVQKAIATKVAHCKPGEWIQGWGWDAADLGVGDVSGLTKEHIDLVAPDHPVVLTEFSMHTIWVNSKALELAGITNDAADPHGCIVRDDRGNPTGVLKESAVPLIKAMIPKFTDDEIRQAAVLGIKELNALGITSITDPLVSEKELNIYKSIKNDGNLTIRLNMLSCSNVHGFSPTLDQTKKTVAWIKSLDWEDPHMLKMAGIKLFADGIPPSLTAWMREPYVGTDQRGGLVTEGATDEEKCASLAEMISYANAEGCQIGVHAVGDRAVDAVVDSFVAALKMHRTDRRHYIIHGDFVSPQTANVMAENGIGLAAQAMIKWLIAAHLHFLIPESLAGYMCPLRTLFDAGVRVSGGSDMPITDPTWKRGIQSAVLRDAKDSNGVFGAEQRITRQEAIRSYTINGAWQDHMETVKGSIEIGKAADFCILAEDILTVDAHTIADIETDMTILNGVIVYQR